MFIFFFIILIYIFFKKKKIIIIGTNICTMINVDDKYTRMRVEDNIVKEEQRGIIKLIG